MQISDLHLSQFDDRGRTPDFSRMCSVHIPIIHPDVVIISGDITDAKFPKMQGSTQFMKEWSAYERIVKKSGLLKTIKWLDLRGNHDNFNVPSADHADNYFRLYSVHGPNFTQSYMINHRKSFGTYTFIAMDACPTPGIKRPHNFFGLITTDLAKSLQSFSIKALNSNQTFWFGHYPTSTIISPGFDLRGLIGKTAYSYFCGHLHTLMNLVPNMYTVQPQGFLELELADWRDSRFFRIVAVDNDLVSFVDARMHKRDIDDWPLVLITNPKDAGFLLPNKEPTERILKSTHVRILVWSRYPIRRVSVSIDGAYVGDAKSAVRHDVSIVESPLYVLPWDPAELARRGPPSGHLAHSIEVVCEDANHNVRTVKQSFTLDGTARWNFGGIQSFILLSDQASGLMVVFYLVWLVPFLTLVTARLFGSTRLYCRLCEDICQLGGLREAASCDGIFFSIFSYLLYVLCGPTFMGYLLDYKFGVVFTFGIFVCNTFVPESTTYMVEIMQQLLFTYPFITLLVCRMRGGGRPHYHARREKSCPHRWCCCVLCCTALSRRHRELLAMCVLTMLQVGFSVTEVLLPYGWLAFLLSPCRLWYLGLSWVVFLHAGRVVATRRADVFGDSTSAD